jgi:hypothetical protein
MSFSNRRRRRFIRRVALGLAVAAVVAPTAAAVGPRGSNPHDGAWFQQKAFIEAQSPALPAIVVGPGGQLTAKKPVLVGPMGPIGQLTPKNPVLPVVVVNPDGQLTAKTPPEAEAPVSFPIGAPRPAPNVIATHTAAPVEDTGFDWRIGVGAGLGALAAIMVGAALLMGRRRGTLQGA